MNGGSEVQRMAREWEETARPQGAEPPTPPAKRKHKQRKASNKQQKGMSPPATQQLEQQSSAATPTPPAAAEPSAPAQRQTRYGMRANTRKDWSWIRG